MARDTRLKVSTRKACSKKRRAWNKSVASKKVATSVAPPAVSPVGSRTEPCATTSTSVRSQPHLPPLECAGASSSAEHIDDNVPGPSSRAERVDTVFYTDEACAEREERAKRVKSSLADISATSRKFDLLDVSMASDDNDHGTEFIVVGMEVLRKFFCATTCTQCGTVGSCLIRRSLEKDRKRLYKANKGHTENEKLKRRMSKRHQPNASQDYCPGLL
ncbi:hypothetical protein HPB50_008449 [Hyalomma asiaticum]|uniref:Uncharacterized protein n=1 Tax=Hyalomma asiaticum TaxID=266040 RepID=A0ACB7TH39_HYAAI|nr:hypothetical protein HPB50_008449 [Hyalomma asiaticum]